MTRDELIEQQIERYVDHFLMTPAEAMQRPPFQREAVPHESHQVSRSGNMVRESLIRDATERGWQLQETK
mgnify:CR=1 FL=1